MEEGLAAGRHWEIRMQNFENLSIFVLSGWGSGPACLKGTLKPEPEAESAKYPAPET